MVDVSLQTFGKLALRPPGGDDGPVSRNSVGLAILAYLSQIPDHTSQRRHLAQLFWPHADLQRGRRLLRQALYYVTKELSQPITRRTDETVALAVDRCTVDVLEFRNRLISGEFREAIELYQGEFLGSFSVSNRTEFGHWLDVRQQHIRRQLQRAYRQQIRTLLERGEFENGARRAVEYVRSNPGDHGFHGRCMKRLINIGHEADAFQLYETYRMALLDRGHDVPTEIVRLMARGDTDSSTLKSDRPPIWGADPGKYV